MMIMTVFVLDGRHDNDDDEGTKTTTTLFYLASL